MWGASKQGAQNISCISVVVYTDPDMQMISGQEQILTELPVSPTYMGNHTISQIW